MKKLKRQAKDYLAQAQAMQHQGRLAEAEAMYRQGLAKTAQGVEQGLGQSVDLHFSLGDCLFRQGRLEDAVAEFEQTVSLAPAKLQAWLNLIALYGQLHDGERLARAFERTIELDPSDPRRFSDFLVQSWTLPLSPEQRYARFREWNRLHAQPLMPIKPEWPNDPHPERRLRIGYVSGDFGIGSAAQLVLPMFLAPDRESFEIYAYHSGTADDAGTRMFADQSDSWHRVHAWSDERLLAQIRSDRIDLLVDLSGHTGYHRLAVFARRPAPLQFTGLGFVSTTGLDAIQYRFTDRWVTPSELEPFNSESCLYLDSVLHWLPVVDLTPFRVPEPPCLRKGHLTFGCLNLPYKLNSAVLGLWIDILRALPESRLIFKGGGYHLPELQRRYRASFAAQGVDPARLDFIGHSPMQAHLRFYGEIDIALDPFPYQGGIVTCEALGLGVPVLSLSTGTRTSVSALANAGLPELITPTPRAYLQTALELAAQPRRLAQWRRELPQRFLASPVCDLTAKARAVETHYRACWRQWCAQR